MPVTGRSRGFRVKVLDKTDSQADCSDAIPLAERTEVVNLMAFLSISRGSGSVMALSSHQHKRNPFWTFFILSADPDLKRSFGDDPVCTMDPWTVDRLGRYKDNLDPPDACAELALLESHVQTDITQI